MNDSRNSIEDERSPLISSLRPEQGDSDSSASPRRSPARRPSPRRSLTDRRVSDGVIRQPVQYYSINNSSGSYNSSNDMETSAAVSRYKYYNRLAPHSESLLTMPDHVVPSVFLLSNILPSAPSAQPSWVTIFSLWNTMMGTSLLSMPWAIYQAGFVTGIALLVAMAGIMLYTSYRILKSVEDIKIPGNEMIDFSDVCRSYLGRWAEVLAFIGSFLTLLGGMIIYWILVSNFLYNIVSFIYHHVDGDETTTADSNDPLCPSDTHSNNSLPPPNVTMATSLHSQESTFQKYWDEQKTVPFFVILVLFPLINLKSPTFFTKFNALGTISVTYLACFALKNAISWGVHMDFHDTTSPSYVHEFRLTFPALTGIASLAYFVHNCVLSITRTQKNPENNVRDLIIAYVLVCITYVYMGVMFYIAFGLDKSCIQDNFLNNLKDTNNMAFVARIGMFFQLICVYPLLSYILRTLVLNSFFGSIWPSLTHVLVLNAVMVAICIVFAAFLPHIGRIIGFVGAFCGFTYAIALPCLVFMKIRYNKGTLTPPIVVFHSIVIVLGFANFIAQFLLI